MFTGRETALGIAEQHRVGVHIQIEDVHAAGNHFGFRFRLGFGFGFRFRFRFRLGFRLHILFLHQEGDVIGGRTVVVDDHALGAAVQQHIAADLSRPGGLNPVLAGVQVALVIRQQGFVGGGIHIVDVHAARHGFRLHILFLHQEGNVIGGRAVVVDDHALGAAVQQHIAADLSRPGGLNPVLAGVQVALVIRQQGFVGGGIHIVDVHAARHGFRLHILFLHQEGNVIGGRAVVVDDHALGAAVQQHIAADLSRPGGFNPVFAGIQVALVIRQQGFVGGGIHIVDVHAAQYRFGFGFRFGFRFRLGNLRLGHGHGGQIHRIAGIGHILRACIQLHSRREADAIRRRSISGRIGLGTIRQAVAAVHGHSRQVHAGCPVHIGRQLAPVHHCAIFTAGGIDIHTALLAVHIGVLHGNHRQHGNIHHGHCHGGCGHRQLRYQHQQGHQQSRCPFQGVFPEFFHPVLLLHWPGIVAVFMTTPHFAAGFGCAWDVYRTHLLMLYCKVSALPCQEREGRSYPLKPWFFTIVTGFCMFFFSFTRGGRDRRRIVLSDYTNWRRI